MCVWGGVAQNGIKGWIYEVGAACQVWRRVIPEEVGAAVNGGKMG